MRCTAIVPAYLAENTIARTLRSLVEDNADAIERVIVVCSPGDSTSEIARRFDGVDVVAACERLSAGRARAVGREQAPSARLLMFVDADSALDAGAVGTLIDALDARGLDAVGAAIVREGGGGVAWLRHLLEFKESEVGVPAANPPMLPSAAFLCRADVYDRAGGFPDLWPGEDLVLCGRLRAAGARLAKIDSAVARHLHPDGLGTFLAHQRRLGATSARARLEVDMPGRVFVARPWLVPLLVAARAGRGVAWVARYRRRELGRFAALAPIYLAGLASWGLGFASAAVRGMGERT